MTCFLSRMSLSVLSNKPLRTNLKEWSSHEGSNHQLVSAVSLRFSVIKVKQSRELHMVPRHDERLFQGHIDGPSEVSIASIVFALHEDNKIHPDALFA